MFRRIQDARSRHNVGEKGCFGTAFRGGRTTWSPGGLVIGALALMAVVLAGAQGLAVEPDDSRPGDAGSRQDGKMTAGRIVKTINRYWTFNYFPAEDADSGFQDVGFDDGQWPAIALPHTWSTYETTGELHPFIHELNNPYWWHGWGWYRKHLVLGKQFSGCKVFVEFDGVQKYCKVWLNGKPVGDHKGGFNPFSVDVTDHVRFGGDNVLAVAVNNRQDDRYRIPPMTAGNWNVYGGIYRDARLVIKDRLHIPFQGSAEYQGGTFVTTPKVSQSEATVRVRTWVKNDYGQPCSCTLRTTITDAEDRTVQILKTSHRIEPGVIHEFDQTSRPIASPRLWSPESPYLYRVVSEVYDADCLVDRYESPLGLRWFEWNYDENRLYLNGKKVHIHGTNRVQDYPWLGDAVPKWIHEMDMRDIRYGLGHNFIRTCVHPNDDCVHDFCDRHGVMVNICSPNIKNLDFSEEVQEQMLREVIRRHRNRPSVLFWSMGNETNDGADSKWAIEEDTTRIIHARHVAPDSYGDYVTHTHENMDMENLLRVTIRGWYNKDVKDFEPKYGQHCGTEEWQHAMARVTDGSIRGRIDMGNGVMWCYNDYGCNRVYKNCPLLHVNPKGWVDSYRVPKYVYYLWQANYAKRPMVFIHPHYWRSQYTGQKKEIVVDSNCDQVELKVNGTSQGVLHPTNENFHTVTFKDVRIVPGTLTAEGKKGDQTASTSVVMAGEPARVVLTTSHQEIPAGRDSVAIVKADIIDAKGVHVYGATNTIKWWVAGPATLVGPSIYKSDIDRCGQMGGTMYTDAPVANVIRSTGRPGLITVRAAGVGLTSGTVWITVRQRAELAVAGIVEPPVPDGSRRPVARNVAAAQPVTLAPPPEMKNTTEDIHLKADTVKGYADQLRRILHKRNPKIDPASAEFRAMVNHFARHLQRNQGVLVADDYNFNVLHYNNCRRITRLIDTAKLPSLFKQTLKEHYARLIIEQGVEKDFQEEKNLIGAIPAKSTLVVVGKAGVAEGLEGVVQTELDQLDAIVRLVHPRFEALDDSLKARTLDYLGRINPYVDKKIVQVPGGKPRVTYEVKKGRPILIPDIQDVIIQLKGKP